MRSGDIARAHDGRAGAIDDERGPPDFAVGAEIDVIVDVQLCKGSAENHLNGRSISDHGVGIDRQLRAGVANDVSRVEKQTVGKCRMAAVLDGHRTTGRDLEAGDVGGLQYPAVNIEIAVDHELSVDCAEANIDRAGRVDRHSANAGIEKRPVDRGADVESAGCGRGRADSHGGGAAADVLIEVRRAVYRERAALTGHSARADVQAALVDQAVARLDDDCAAIDRRATGIRT